MEEFPALTGPPCQLLQVDVDVVMSGGEWRYAAVTDNGPTLEPYFNVPWLHKLSTVSQIMHRRYHGLTGTSGRTDLANDVQVNFNLALCVSGFGPMCLYLVLLKEIRGVVV